jgi:D-amino-acid dehydrogenase
MNALPRAIDPRSVIVVGAGVIGTSCAFVLQGRGYAVTLVDRLEPGEACSFGNAGVIATSACVPLILPGTLRKAPSWLLDRDGPLAVDWRYLPTLMPWIGRAWRAAGLARVRAAAMALRDLHGTAADDHLAQAAEANCGHLIAKSDYLHVYRSSAALAEDRLAWELRRELGLHWRELDAGELREVEPALGDQFECGILMHGHAAAPDPGGLVKALAKAFALRQGRYLRASVTALRSTEHGVIAETSAGRQSAAHVVLAAGAWSAELAWSLGHRFPLVAERGYHVVYGEPGIRLRQPVMFAETKFVAHSMNAGLRCAGTAEFAAPDRPLRPARVAAIERVAKAALPGLQTNEATSWVGARPSLPDTLPVIGRSHLHPRVVFAFGHGHTGLTASAKTARIVADIVAGEPPSIDIAPFRPDRFSARAATRRAARSS